MSGVADVMVEFLCEMAWIFVEGVCRVVFDVLTQHMKPLRQMDLLFCIIIGLCVIAMIMGVGAVGSH